MKDKYLFSAESDPVMVFPTDGSNFVNTGIALILSALRSRFFGDLFKVWIVVPPGTQSDQERFFSKLAGSSSFSYLNGNVRDDDMYFIQLGMLDVADRLADDQVMVCIDYDHLATASSPFSAFILPDNSIRVSSETGCIAVDPVPPELHALQGDNGLVTHLNASLILGRARELSSISGPWKSSYEEISNRVDFRHRVEIALSIAAKRTSVDIAPVEPQFQGNFMYPADDPFLFHYGGESAISSQMKKGLGEISDLFSGVGPSDDYAIELHDDLCLELDLLMKTTRDKNN